MDECLEKEIAKEIWIYLNETYDIDVDIDDIENIVESVIGGEY